MNQIDLGLHAFLNAATIVDLFLDLVLAIRNMVDFHHAGTVQ